MSVISVALLALATGFASIANAQSGTGTTTRYWDCCKPSCAWSGKADVSSPVAQCDANNNVLTTGDAAKSGCDGGSAYMCADQTPFVDSENPNLAYGFAAANVGGQGESGSCCSCYELTFTSTSLAAAGKKYIVQVTNSGTDLVNNQFDLAFPGGGVGIFNACNNEYGSGLTLGAQYGGISSATDCSSWPAALQAGCNFRFGWFEGADNPTVSYQEVTCPKALTDKTGCIRSGQTPTGSGSTSSAAAPVASSSAAAASSSAPASSSATTQAATSSYQAPSSSSTTAGATTTATSSAAASSYSASSSTTTAAASSSSPAAYSSSATSAAASSSSPAAYTSAATTSAAATSSSSVAASSTPAAPACPVQYVYVDDE